MGSTMESQTLLRLKFDLLSNGARLAPGTEEAIQLRAKLPQRVRSGTSSGLDIRLSDCTVVNCPTDESLASRSSLVLAFEDDVFLIAEGTQLRARVAVTPRPAYYSSRTSNGVPMNWIGQISGDRLGIGLTNDCCFWRSPRTRCKFCSIGFNLRNELREKSLHQILEVVDAAFTDPVLPAKHLLLGGGTFEGPDRGAVPIAEVSREIRKRYHFPIYVMICPPAENGYIDLLKEAGVDEIAFNLEVFDDDIARELTPGKYHIIGRKRYFEALEYAVSVFGKINTRSILIVGLEPPESTVRGAEFLASMGVMPILSPFRPLNETEMEDRRPPDADTLMDMTIKADEAASKYGVPLGPLCLACQNNTLTLPHKHPEYRFY